jgi:DNA-binding beta-propeller fold protein YncE
MSLKFLHYIDLPENIGTGGFDHAAIHQAGKRLYVAHTINNALDVIDLAEDRYLHSIPGLSVVAGALVAEKQGLVFTSNRGENTVGIFAVGDEEHLVKVPVGMGPNGLAFDAEHGLLLACNVGNPNIPGSFTISVVDIEKHEMIHSIQVPGRTRWAVFDPGREEFFVNIAEPARIVVIAAGKPDRIARSIIIPFAGPHGLDVDSATDRLFCACDSGKLVTLEASSGIILRTADLSGKPDVIFFNPVLKHLYVAVGDPSVPAPHDPRFVEGRSWGLIDVFETKTLARLEAVPTEKGAHTLAFDAVQNKVYAFLPETHRAEVFADA